MSSKKRDDTFVSTLADTVEPLTETAEQIEKTIKDTIKPEIDSAVKRFPRLFVLLVAFGVSAVLYGFDWILDQFTFFTDHGWIVMFVGIGILTFTGTLFKKL